MGGDHCSRVVYLALLFKLTSGFAYLLSAFCVRLTQTVETASLPKDFD